MTQKVDKLILQNEGDPNSLRGHKVSTGFLDDRVAGLRIGLTKISLKASKPCLKMFSDWKIKKTKLPNYFITQEWGFTEFVYLWPKSAGYSQGTGFGGSVTQDREFTENIIIYDPRAPDIHSV